MSFIPNTKSDLLFWHNSRMTWIIIFVRDAFRAVLPGMENPISSSFSKRKDLKRVILIFRHDESFSFVKFPVNTSDNVDKLNEVFWISCSFFFFFSSVGPCVGLPQLIGGRGNTERHSLDLPAAPGEIVRCVPST